MERKEEIEEEVEDDESKEESPGDVALYKEMWSDFEKLGVQFPGLNIRLVATLIQKYLPPVLKAIQKTNVSLQSRECELEFRMCRWLATRRGENEAVINRQHGVGLQAYTSLLQDLQKSKTSLEQVYDGFFLRERDSPTTKDWIRYRATRPYPQPARNHRTDPWPCGRETKWTCVSKKTILREPVPLDGSYKKGWGFILCVSSEHPEPYNKKRMLASGHYLRTRIKKRNLFEYPKWHTRVEINEVELADEQGQGPEEHIHHEIECECMPTESDGGGVERFLQFAMVMTIRAMSERSV